MNAKMSSLYLKKRSKLIFGPCLRQFKGYLACTELGTALPQLVPALYLNSVLYRCGCDDCTESRSEDSLRHSRRRINAYRALASPSLIALSSKDPILTAFELSWELRRLAFSEHEFKSEYLVSKSLLAFITCTHPPPHWALM